VRLGEEHDVVDEPVRERETVPDVQYNAEEICSPGKESMNRIQNRSHKEEREFSPPWLAMARVWQRDLQLSCGQRISSRSSTPLELLGHHFA
jgi:hypothetical protein